MNKYIYTIFMLVIVVFTSINIIAQTATPPSGSGTSGSPYLIETLNNLYWVSTNVASSSGIFYKQTADIDASSTSGWFSGAGWVPIGNSTNRFQGTYDGNGFKVDGLFINRPSTSYIGLFGLIKLCTIKNLGITGVNITGFNYTGGLVGQVDNGTLSNCYSTGSVAVFNSGQLGGLVGSAQRTTINNCYSSCNVTATGTTQGNNIGGLVGLFTTYTGGGNTLSDSYATGTVKSLTGGTLVGGFVGNLDGSGTVNNCYSTGDVGNLDSTTEGFVGGFVGYMHSNNINNCYSTGNVYGRTNTGGFVGYSEAGGTVTNCYSMGDVTRNTASSSTSYGGFIGYNQSTISLSFSIGSVIYTGATNPTDKGFVGTDASGSYSVNFFDSEISAQTSGTGATAKTTTLMKTQSTFTDATWDFAGESVNGTNDYWTRDDNKNGGYPYLSWQTFTYSVTFTDGSGFTTTPTAGQTNQPIGRLALNTNSPGAVFDGIWVKLNGTRTGLTNFKLWESNDNSFSSASDTQIGSTVAADPGDGNNIWFLSLSRALSTSDKYYFITCDVASNATGSIQAFITGNKEIMLGFSTLNSTITNSSLSSAVEPLPVELTSFSAFAEGNTIQLNWRTATEVNNFGFEIERASSSTTLVGSEWTKIGFVQGHGTSNTPYEYTFIDNNLLSGIKFNYRLKQIDVDGKYEYSDVLTVIINVSKEAELMQNSPNPFNPTTTIKYSIPTVIARSGATLQSVEISLNIYDILGREVATLVKEKHAPGNYKVEFNGSDLPSGVYLYRLTYGNRIKTKKMTLLK